MASVQDLPRLEAVRGQRIFLNFYDEDEDLLSYDLMKQLTGGDPIHFNAVKAMPVDYYNKKVDEK